MRRNYYTGKYALDKNEFLNAKYYALRYNKWRDEYEALEDTGRGIRYDKEKVQTSGDYDPVQENGIRRAELAKKRAERNELFGENDPAEARRKFQKDQSRAEMRSAGAQAAETAAQIMQRIKKALLPFRN